MMKVESYAPYSAKAFAEASKHKRVLFFASSWCPSCRNADKDTTENIKFIPADTVIFKTDYDAETALKTKYLVTRQHTFVWVDAKGELSKNGAVAARVTLPKPSAAPSNLSEATEAVKLAASFSLCALRGLVC